MEMVCLMTPSCHFPVREMKEREGGREGGERDGGRKRGRERGERDRGREIGREGGRESICIAQKSKFNLATHDKTVCVHVHIHTWQLHTCCST